LPVPEPARGEKDMFLRPDPEKQLLRGLQKKKTQAGGKIHIPLLRVAWLLGTHAASLREVLMLLMKKRHGPGQWGREACALQRSGGGSARPGRLLNDLGILMVAAQKFGRFAVRKFSAGLGCPRKACLKARRRKGRDFRDIMRFYSGKIEKKGDRGGGDAELPGRGNPSVAGRAIGAGGFLPGYELSFPWTAGLVGPAGNRTARTLVRSSQCA